MTSWQYVAGFFDGEGTVCYYRKRGQLLPSLCAQMVQKTDGVLRKISDFLEAEGVHSKVKFRPPGKHVRSKTGMFSLHIWRRDSAKRFFERVLPFLIVKKVVVQDVLRFRRCFPVLSASQASNLKWQNWTEDARSEWGRRMRAAQG